jgi:outer membrane protein
MLVKLCKLTWLALLVAVVCATSAQAQSPRIGYVNMKEVLDNAPQVVSGREQLDQEFRPRNDLIENEEIRVQSLEETLRAGDLSSTDRNRLDREILEARRSISRQREDLRDELSFRRTEEVQKLEAQINVAVQEIAQQYGYDLILSSPVVYANPALDVTDLILQQLQIEYDADQRERAQP